VCGGGGVVALPRPLTISVQAVRFRRLFFITKT
jgi:hypothetical protein